MAGLGKRPATAVKARERKHAEEGRLATVADLKKRVTPRKETEDQLRLSERRLSEVQRIAHIGSWERDLRTNRVTWSEETYRLFGEAPSAEQTTYDLFLARVHPHDVRKIRHTLQKALRERKPFSTEYRVTTAQGSCKILQDRGEVITDAAGVPIRLVGMVQDVTPCHRNEDDREALYQQVLTSREDLRILSHRLLHAQEEERRRLAGELHDEIGQVLTAVSLSLELTKTMVNEGARQRLEESMAVVDRAIDQVRSMSLNLRPAMLDLMGLESALRWFIGRHVAATGLQIDLISSLQGQRFAADLETACFRIVQESVTNVTRHAQAQGVRIELASDRMEFFLTIQDNGSGFDTAAARRRAAHGTSFGLLGMEERAHLLGGQFAIISTPGSGTRVQVRLPWK